MILSETHFTGRNYLKISNYKDYHTTHPDGKAHGGSAILIKKKINHHQAISHRDEQIQATNVMIKDWIGPIMISAVYCPPKHKIKKDYFIKFFKSLGNRFIAGGDYNAKHTFWGLRLHY